MTAPSEAERMQLLALRMQLVAGVTLIDSMIGVPRDEAPAASDGAAARCTHPEGQVKTFGGGFGESQDNQPTRICGQCGDSV